MRNNQITITCPQDSTDLRAELFALKNQYSVNISHFCRKCIEKGLADYKTVLSASVMP